MADHRHPWRPVIGSLVSDDSWEGFCFGICFRSQLCALLPQFHVNASYPRDWNMPQAWQCEIEVYKATYHFIYAQKNFFTGEGYVVGSLSSALH